MHDQVFTDVTAKKKLNKIPYNPCEPCYKIRDENGVVIDYGHVTGSTVPKPYFRKNPEDCDPSLRTKDIVGNLPGTRGLGNFHNRERR